MLCVVCVVVGKAMCLSRSVDGREGPPVVSSNTFIYLLGS